MEKYLQAQFLPIHHGFTLGFRSDTSKSCSVGLCSTFSWCRLPDLWVWNVTGVHWVFFCCWTAPGLGLLKMSFVMHRVYDHGAKVGVSYRQRRRCEACTVSVLHPYTASFPCHYDTPLLVAVTRIPSGLWHFSVLGSMCVNPVGVAIPSTCSFSTSFQVH